MNSAAFSKFRQTKHEPRRLAAYYGRKWRVQGNNALIKNELEREGRADRICY